MSKARHLGNLLDTDGDVISSSLDNVDTSSFIEKTNWQHNAGTVGTFNETASIGTINVGAISGLSGSSMTATSNDLPAGLSLSAAGALTGTHPNITATTTSTFNVSVTDGTNNASREYTITNTADNDAPVWNTASGALTAGGNTAYSVQLSATEPEGGSLTYSLVSGSLPNSLSMNSSGLISGTPSADGTFNFTISVTDGTTPVSRSFSIAVTLWQGMAATGGTITTDGDYKVHSFTSSGNFQITTLGDIGTVEYLVVAGAGGGGAIAIQNGSKAYGGGGGAGGYRTATGFSVSATTYTITVGGGGATSTNGSDSVFSSITSISGGAGCEDNDNGSSGGSGGGGGGKDGGGSGGAGTAGQGYAGGHGSTSNATVGGGGGGGASEIGGSAGTTHYGGDGGDGISNDITGSAVTYAGGGGGCNMVNTPQNNGGAGGGGDGGYLCESSSCINESDGNPGTVNTGGGGGGGARTSPGVRSDYFRNGGTGGSGIVIIRYKFQQ